MDLIDRTILLADAQDDEKLQGYLLELCRRDPIYWFNTFCWTFDPRKADSGEPGDIPFELYPFQEWTIREWHNCLEAQESFCIEKSRDMGVSWMIMLLFQYCWLFRPGWNFLVGSYKEAFVDTATVDPSTLFGKLRYNLELLPPWMKPPPNKIKDKMCLLQNELNGNLITGDTANPKFGRGSRQRAILLDEFAFWDYADAIFDGAASTTNCLIPNSTPYGETNRYAKILNDKENVLMMPPGADALYTGKLQGKIMADKKREKIQTTLDVAS